MGRGKPACSGHTGRDSHRYYAVTTDVTYLGRNQMGLMALNRPHNAQQRYRYVLVTDATSKIIAGYWSRLRESDSPTLLLATSTLTSSSIPEIDLSWVRHMVDPEDTAP